MKRSFSVGCLMTLLELVVLQAEYLGIKFPVRFTFIKDESHRDKSYRSRGTEVGSRSDEEYDEKKGLETPEIFNAGFWGELQGLELSMQIWSAVYVREA